MSQTRRGTRIGVAALDPAFQRVATLGASLIAGSASPLGRAHIRERDLCRKRGELDVHVEETSPPARSGRDHRCRGGGLELDPERPAAPQTPIRSLAARASATAPAAFKPL